MLGWEVQAVHWSFPHLLAPCVNYLMLFLPFLILSSSLFQGALWWHSQGILFGWFNVKCFGIVPSQRQCEFIESCLMAVLKGSWLLFPQSQPVGVQFLKLSLFVSKQKDVVLQTSTSKFVVCSYVIFIAFTQDESAVSVGGNRRGHWQKVLTFWHLHPVGITTLANAMHWFLYETWHMTGSQDIMPTVML